MGLWTEFRSRWRGIARRSRLEHDLNAELRDHLDREIEARVARGVSPAEVAQRRASRFGVWHAPSHARFDLTIEMVAQLGVEVSFQARTARDAAPAATKLGEQTHMGAPIG